MQIEADDVNYKFPPKRSSVSFGPRELVAHGESVYRIDRVLDFGNVIAMDLATGRSASLRIAELRPLEAKDDPRIAEFRDIPSVSDKDWQKAQDRLEAIRPLLQTESLSRQQVELRAQQLNVDVSTLYRWMKRYKNHGVTTALIELKRGWTAGKSRLDDNQDAVITEVIRDYYLTSQRHTAEKTILEVERICELRGIKKPSGSAVRKRISDLSEKERLRGRGQREKADNKFTPKPGAFPNADYRHAVMQIDHTPVDVIIVDDQHRKPIGRPWLTLAIDVCTRNVMGYYLSLDAPSIASVALCITHAVLPKEDWLALHEVNAEWPVWGFPTKIHVDNGAEFRSDDLRKSCTQYGVILEYRQMGTPHFGGHIERLLGTFMAEVHTLPGTTFSSVEDKEDYDSEKLAVLTLGELEKWLVTYTCNIYHQKKHNGIGMSPRRKWELETFGDGDKPALGIPPRPVDGATILLDFLPSFHRTVQPDGVTLDGLRYYADVLRSFISLKDENNDSVKQLFRRDPRDVSVLWFFEPTAKLYFKIPTADLSVPPMSLWAWDAVKKKIKKQGGAINQSLILQTVTEMRGIVKEASAKTTSARRKAQRQKEHDKQTSPADPLKTGKAEAAPKSIPQGAPSAGMNILLSDDIVPFGDIA